jgi:hypothetical protein
MSGWQNHPIYRYLDKDFDSRKVRVDRYLFNCVLTRGSQGSDLRKTQYSLLFNGSDSSTTYVLRITCPCSINA